LLVVAFFYLLLIRRNYLAAALAAGLASAVKPYGFVLVGAFAFELLRRHRELYGLKPDWRSPELRSLVTW
jgi:hypothetical protein